MIHRRRFGYNKPGLLTVNHCDGTSFTTAAATTNQRPIFTAVDNPGNRNADIMTGSVLVEVDIWMWCIDGTPPAGKHECLMVFQPGATTYTDPIASWLSNLSPLTEEAIQVRQNIMGTYHRKNIVAGVAEPLRWRCHWRGRKPLREDDDVVVCIRDLQVTNWDVYCVAKYIQ